jgi:hypothetical protein
MPPTRVEAAIDAAKAGDKKAAKELLQLALKDDPKDARAWYIYSQVVDDKKQQAYCLKKILEFHPENQQIQEQLARLEPPVSSTNKKRDTWIVIGLLALLAALCMCIGITTLPNSSSQVASNPQAQPVTALSYFTIREKQRVLTGVQWDAYEKSIMGKRVQWQGFVSEIKPDITGNNFIWVDMDNPPDGMQDVYFSYPVDKSLQYSKGQRITFRGDFDGGIEVIIFEVELKNAEIIK